MMTRALLVLGLLSLARSELGAQAAARPRLEITGDTTGAPPGCSAQEAIATIEAWFAAYNRGDVIRTARATRLRHFVFTNGKFTPSDTFVTVRSLPELVRHVRARARQRERLELTRIHFWGWIYRNKRALTFMPYYLRRADDLGPAPLEGWGKAGYYCGQGIEVLNLAPRPRADLGPPGFRRAAPPNVR